MLLQVMHYQFGETIESNLNEDASAHPLDCLPLNAKRSRHRRFLGTSIGETTAAVLICQKSNGSSAAGAC